MSVSAPDKDVASDAALIHLYRGELGRMTEYRIRLDTTTNWAIGMNAAVLSFALGRNVTHGVFGLAVFLTLMFLWMEARRFRSYELIRWRVRRLETGFFQEQLGGEPEPRWREALRDDLSKPSPPISYWYALSVRLRRNYLWVVLIIYVAWGYRLFEAGDIAEQAALGPVPGIAVLIAAGAVFVSLVVLAFRYVAYEEG